MKQCEENPWAAYASKVNPGDIIEGEIRNITDFGLFVGLEGDIDGLVHHSDLSWTEPGDAAIKNFKKGDIVKAKVLATDVERERISLGIKQLTEAPEGALTAAASAPAAESGSKFKKGDTVTVTVSAIENG